MGPQPLLRKSRAGCRTCRARRVKCDEVRPACGNCIRRFVHPNHCEYADATTRLARPSAAVRRISRHCVSDTPIRSLDRSTPDFWDLSRNPPLRPVSIPDTSRWHSLELRLMHHYTAVVCKTMPNCNGLPAADMWEKTIPQFAFDSDVVLSPLLAVSALHLHAHSPTNKPMSFALSRYLDKTLVTHRQSLPLFDGEMAQHVWLSAVILASLYWLLARQAGPSGEYELPLQAWTMSQGVSQLFVHKKTLLGQLGYSWFGYENAPRVLPSSELSLESQLQLRGVEEDMASLLARFRVHALPRPEQEVYTEAQAYVFHYYRAYYAGATAKYLRRFIGTMVIRCRPSYRKLLERHDPLAMALLARLTALLKGLEYVWWMNGKGDYEVLEREIYGIRALMPKHVRWAMDWPCGVLSGEVALSRPESDTITPVDFIPWVT